MNVYKACRALERISEAATAPWLPGRGVSWDAHIASVFAVIDREVAACKAPVTHEQLQFPGMEDA